MVQEKQKRCNNSRQNLSSFPWEWRMILLNHVKGLTCYEDIRIVDGIIYPTFKEACYALGLLDDEKEYIDDIMEASFWGSAHYLRKLYVMLIKSGNMTMPDNVSESTWRPITYLLINEEYFELKKIEELLHKNGSILKNFPSVPQPDQNLISHGLNKIIQDELRYDREELIQEHQTLIPKFTMIRS
ncbi:hypothetical protein V2J09_012695 [Rumex salicifolius]